MSVIHAEGSIKSMDIEGNRNGDVGNEEQKGLSIRSSGKSAFDENKSRPLWRIIVEDIPFVNLIYDLIFDTNPHPDGLKDALNLIGLIDALILGFALSMLTSIDYQELLDADNRFMDPSVNNDPLGYHEYYESKEFGTTGSVSAIFAFNIYMAILFMFVSLIIVLLIYLDYVNKSFDARTKDDQSTLYTSWWKYAKYCLLLCFLACVFGLWYAASAVKWIIFVKYPDYYVAIHGKTNGEEEYTYGSYMKLGNAIIVLLVPVGLFLGFGTRNRYKKGRKLELLEEKAITASNIQRDLINWKQLLYSDLCKPISEPKVLEEFLESVISERIMFKHKHHLTDEHLKTMGISRLGHRLVLLEAFAHWNNNMVNKFDK
jgi:hypothetical protein